MEFFYRLNKYRTDILLLAIVIIASSVFFLHNLGSSYITLWDEAIHVNVVKNLTNNCCVPTLHLQNLGTDYKDWSNNYIWVHKPLLPFYVDAVFYKLFGQNLYAFRLPNYIFAELTVIIVYIVGAVYFNKRTAFLAAALLATNSYVLALVAGRQFSELSDIMFGVFTALILLFILKIRDETKTNRLLILGALVGLAYLCKGGLALAPLVVLAYVLWQKGGIRELLLIIYAVLIAAFIIVPDKLILTRLFPAETSYEDKVQLMHLYRSVEYWGRPWDYYLSFYFKTLVGPLLALLGYLGIGYGIKIKNRASTPLILSIWVLCYIIPLSFGVSKISNFVYAVLPVICILIAHLIFDLWDKKKFALLAALGFSIIAAVLLTKLNIFGVNGYVNLETTILNRFGTLFIELALFLVTYLIFRLFKTGYLKYISLALLLLGLILYVRVTLKKNWNDNIAKPADYAAQMTAKQTGQLLKSQLPQNSILIIRSDKLEKSHLYFQYWSGYDSLDATNDQPIASMVTLVKSHTEKTSNIYLISSSPMSQLTLIKQVPFGYLYLLPQ